MPRNPFLNRSMLRSVDEFHGRKRALEQGMARIGANVPQSVSVVGERRVGKSSLLWHLMQPEVHRTHLDNSADYVFLLLDCQGQQHLDPQGFCRAFGQQLQQAVGAKLTIPDLNDLSGIQAAVARLAQSKFRLVCLFDEFETITRNAQFGSEFFGFLRALANAYPVAFITASRRPLQDLCHNEEIAESPFFNIFTQIRLGPMPNSEIRQLVCAPSAAAGFPLEPHLAEIQRLGGNLPFFCQIAAAAAFDYLQEIGTDAPNWDEVELAFLEEATSHFNYLWERFDPEEQQVIAAAIRRDELPAQLEKARSSLVADGYLQPQGSIFSEAFAKFLQQQGAVHLQPHTPAQQETLAPPFYRRVSFVLVILVVLLGVVGFSFLDRWSSATPSAYLLYENKEGQEGQIKLDALRTNLDQLSGDTRFRFVFTPDKERYIYAYQIASNGRISHLPDPDYSGPIPLAAATPSTLPSTAWLKRTPNTAATLYLLVLPQRDRELEELYQRLERTPPHRRAEARRRLLERIEPRATHRLELAVRVAEPRL